VAAIITLFVLVGGATLTTVGPWYRGLNKPWWNPPEWLFGPAWTVILSLAAWAGVLAWTSASSPEDHFRIAVLFGVNIFFHMMWTPLFFNLKRPDWALVEVVFLWFSVAALIVGMAFYSAQASWLLAPYLLWVSFAAYLTLRIVRLNAPFGARTRIAADPSGETP
jgi:tryptophan-rich sensory protein